MDKPERKYPRGPKPGFSKRSPLILLPILFFSLLIPGFSLPASGADAVGAGESCLPDNPYGPPDGALAERYSLAGETLAEAGEHEPRQRGAGGYYGSRDWQAFVALYLWFVGMNGKAGKGNLVADVDMSFGDIWENLDVGAQGHIELWWKRWIFILDPIFMKVSANNSQTRVIASIRSKLEVKMFLMDIAAGYRVAEIPLGGSVQSGKFKSWPSLSVDLYGGGRIPVIDTKLDVSVETPLGVAERRVKDTEAWFDFIVGTRLIFDFTENLLLTVKTDIGGFGLGFSSDVDWNFVANVGYQLPWWGITPYLGYRVLYLDYKDGSGNNRFIYKMWNTGPQVGFGVRF